MHAAYYSREHGMGETYGRKVAAGLAEFWPRLVNPRNRLWLATMPSQEERVVGSIAIDGEDPGGCPAHLPWFILDHGCRGLGVGSALLRKAIEFVDQEGFKRTVLWTSRAWMRPDTSTSATAFGWWRNTPTTFRSSLAAALLRVGGRARHPAGAPARWSRLGVVDRFTDGVFVCSIHT